MAVETAQLLHSLLRCEFLLTRDQTAELVRACYWGSFPRKEDVAGFLKQQGWCTDYQISKLAKGRVQDLKVGKYVIQDKLGEGGFGQVYRAADPRMRRDVTLKILRPEFVEEPTAARRFLREMKVLGQLRNPHFPRCHDASCADDVWFIVMEYIRGLDLNRAVARNGPVSWLRACDVARQVASGLSYIHKHGLVHRDIKPANIICEDHTGRVLLLDFGLARVEKLVPGYSAVSRATASGAILGTFEYMAPEQFEDSKHVDIRADLYGLGCTLYFLVTGQSPFRGRSIGNLVHGVLNEQPVPLDNVCPTIPVEFIRGVTRLMAKRPEDRFQNPKEVAAYFHGLYNVGKVNAELTQDLPVNK